MVHFLGCELIIIYIILIIMTYCYYFLDLQDIFQIINTVFLVLV